MCVCLGRIQTGAAHLITRVMPGKHILTIVQSIHHIIVWLYMHLASEQNVKRDATKSLNLQLCQQGWIINGAKLALAPGPQGPQKPMVHYFVN